MQKKLAKELADLEKIKQQMARGHINNSANQPGTINGTSSQAPGNTLPLSTQNANLAEVPKSVNDTNDSNANRVPSELLTVQASIHALQIEIEKRQKIRNFELAHIEVIQNFMKEVAWLVKPQVVEGNADIMQLGAPLTPEIPHDFFDTTAANSSAISTEEIPSGQTFTAKVETVTQPPDVSSHGIIHYPIPDQYPTYGLQMRDVSNKMSYLLPASVQNLYDKATAWQISQVDDVIMVKDAFRWLSWCNLVLHVLRYPASTPLLRSVLEETKTMRVVDDKILKLLSQILNKAR